MRCTNCGTEFVGKFCPRCGTPAAPRAVPAAPRAVPAQPRPNVPQAAPERILSGRKAVAVLVAFIAAVAMFIAAVLMSDGVLINKKQVYRQAYECIENGDYVQALDFLESISEYKNADDLLNYCYFQINYELIQALCEEEINLGVSYRMIYNYPPCSETAALLREMVEKNTFDLDVFVKDAIASSSYAERKYGYKFFFVQGTVSDFDFDEDEGFYTVLNIKGHPDDVAYCYDLTENDVSAGDDVIVAGFITTSYDGVRFVIRLFESSVVDPDYLYATDSIMDDWDLSNALAEGDEDGMPAATDAPAMTKKPMPTPKPAPTPEPTPAPGPMDAAAGSYVLTDAEVYDADWAIGGDAMTVLSSRAMLVLDAGGTGELDMWDLNIPVTWDEGHIATDNGYYYTWEFDGDTRLYVESDAELLTFTKVDYAQAYARPDNRLQYFIENCDTVYFSRDDILGFDEQDCEYARNGIYARSGRAFQSQELQDYFSRFDWYDPYIAPEDFTDDMLNSCQHANLAVVIAYEEENGY